MCCTSPLRYRSVATGGTSPRASHNSLAISRIEIGRPEHTLAGVKPSGVRVDRRDVGSGDVIDVDEIPHLSAVLENPWHVPCGHSGRVSSAARLTHVGSFLKTDVRKALRGGFDSVKGS
jgi:hypothetical protein